MSNFKKMSEALSTVSSKIEKLACITGQNGVSIHIGNRIITGETTLINSGYTTFSSGCNTKKIRHTHYNNNIVIKMGVANEKTIHEFRNEITILDEIPPHPNIISVVTYNLQYSFPWIAFPRLEYDLFSLVTDIGVPSSEIACKIFRQIVKGILYLHSNGIVHRDIKPENIVVDGVWNVKIIDFGYATKIQDNVFLTRFCGTPDYAAPELLKGIPYCGKEVDIWSLGSLLYVLLEGILPFGNPYKRSEVVEYSNGIDTNIRALIESMLNTNPKLRPSIETISENKWVCVPPN